MKYLKYLAFLFLLTILACSSQISPRYTNHPKSGYFVRAIPVYIDKDFSGKDLGFIKEAIDEWNHALNGTIDFQVIKTDFDMEPADIFNAISTRGLILLKIDSSSPFVHDNPATPEIKTFAFANKIGGNLIYIVEDRVRDSIYKAVVMHELGHILGANHTEGTLMQANDGTIRCIDFKTAEQVAEYNSIPVSLMNYCLEQ